MTILETGIDRTAETTVANWHEVEEGFWVANADGMFVGTIECHKPDRFFARNATRAYVGEYATFEAAKTAVMAHFVRVA
jgi:hypothetical protein